MKRTAMIEDYLCGIVLLWAAWIWFKGSDTSVKDCDNGDGCCLGVFHRRQCFVPVRRSPGSLAAKREPFVLITHIRM